MNIDEHGDLCFDKLYSKMNNSDKTRFWFIYVKLFKNDKHIKITNEFMNVDKCYCEIYTEYGLIDGKVVITEPTIITTGKNLGKSNETNVLTQSISQMKSLFSKKIKSGYTLNINEEKKGIYPMAVHSYDKFKSKIKFPCYVQPKLDGVRMIFTNDKLLSRRLNEYLHFDNIKNELKVISSKDIIIDGELYNEEMTLQEISGICRAETDNVKKELIKYYIFDYIDLKNNKLTFKERIENLQEKFKKNNFKHLVLLETKMISTEKEGDTYYKSLIKKGYEGAIYKNLNAVYEYSNIKEKRSYNYLKRKKQYEDEYEIIDFYTGNGKDKGAIIFTMKTKDDFEFKAVPNATLEERKEMYNIAIKDFNKFKHKMATVRFDEYSKDNVPLRAKFITIRNYE